MPTGFMSIAELCAAFGVTAKTLRFYEEQNLLSPMRFGAARIYSPRDRIRLELILRGKRLGFTLAEIRGLIGDPTGDPAFQPMDVLENASRDYLHHRIRHLEGRRAGVQGAIEELMDALSKRARKG